MARSFAEKNHRQGPGRSAGPAGESAGGGLCGPAPVWGAARAAAGEKRQSVSFGFGLAAAQGAQPMEDMMPISGSITDSRIKPTSTENTATSVGSTSETSLVTSASTSS